MTVATRTALARYAPTLANYGPLDCGVLRIGSTWLIFAEGVLRERPTYSNRTQALLALMELDRAIFARSIHAQQAAIRG